MEIWICNSKYSSRFAVFKSAEKSWNVDTDTYMYLNIDLYLRSDSVWTEATSVDDLIWHILLFSVYFIQRLVVMIWKKKNI